MRLKDIFTEGTRAVFKNAKFFFITWMMNVAFSLAMTIPVYNLIGGSLGNSIIDTGLDYKWLIQFISLNGRAISMVPAALLGICFIYATLQTFFLGGLVSVFNNPKKRHIVDFFYGGVKFWFRFFKVMLISVLLFSIVLLFNEFLGYLIGLIFSSGRLIFFDFLFKALRYIIFIFLIALLIIVSDYSRVMLAIEDRTKVTSGILDTFRFLKNNFRIVLITFLVVGLLGALGGLVYSFLELYISGTAFYFLILSFILQQILIIFRLLIRMLFCSTEVIIFKDLNAKIVVADAVEVSAGE